jgi:hypothetical protein
MGARFVALLIALMVSASSADAQTEGSGPPTPSPSEAQVTAPPPPASAAPPLPDTSSVTPGTPAAPEATPGTPPAPPQPTPPVGTPSVTVLGTQEVQAILGRDVRSTADENMGRIVDVLVDGQGRTRAVIIDFGGFLGVGSRKIAVDWKALHFVPAADKRYGIVLELTRDQVKPAPEFKEGKPVVILGASGNLEPLP